MYVSIYFSLVIIVEFEHSIWYHNSPGFSEFLICLQSSGKPEFFNQPLYYRITNEQWWMNNWRGCIFCPKSFQSFIFIYQRNQGLCPCIKIEVIFDANTLQIHSILCDKKWQTKFVFSALNIFFWPFLESMRILYTNSENGCDTYHNKTCCPDLPRLGYNKKIDIRIFWMCIHGSRITESDHADTWKKWKKPQSYWVTKSGGMKVCIFHRGDFGCMLLFNYSFSGTSLCWDGQGDHREWRQSSELVFRDISWNEDLHW